MKRYVARIGADQVVLQDGAMRRQHYLARLYFARHS
jgi:hypothetical protein